MQFAARVVQLAQHDMRLCCVTLDEDEDERYTWACPHTLVCTVHPEVTQLLHPHPQRLRGSTGLPVAPSRTRENSSTVSFWGSGSMAMHTGTAAITITVTTRQLK